jgi:hypothetical protein
LWWRRLSEVPLIKFFFICTSSQNIYICTPIFREHSSAGSEHLPYKQGVTGSNPVAPTSPSKAIARRVFYLMQVRGQLAQLVQSTTSTR